MREIFFRYVISGHRQNKLPDELEKFLITY